MELLRCKLDHLGNGGGFNLCLGCITHLLDYLFKNRLINRRVDRVLYFHKERSVVRFDCFITEYAHICIDIVQSADVGFSHLLRGNHTVGTYKAIDKGRNAYASHTDLGIADNNTCLDNIALAHLCCDAGIDYLDIHLLVGNLTALHLCPFHSGDNREDGFGNLHIVDAPVLCREERPEVSVKRSEHSALGSAVM